MTTLTHRTRAVLWLGFFALVLVGWGMLWAMGREAAAYQAAYGLDWWIELCRTGAGGTAFWPLVAMWAVMAAAMMAPTVVPVLTTYLDLPNARAVGFAGLLAGYLAVWGGAALGFAALQQALAGQGWIAPTGASLSHWLNAALFAVAGAWQFSALKAGCLSRCRAPLMFLMAHWRDGPTGAAAMGVRLGAVCLGCCWALMALALVGGMANLLWMGLATLLMVVEKLPEVGRWLTRPLGWALLAAAGASALAAIF
jgi:predicted metal-binding membrane protein